jgi:hypothetical protein
MNKEFVRKMIMAEQLRYEAIKEILPETIRKKVDKVELEAFDLLKDLALELIKGRAVDNKAGKVDDKDEGYEENKRNSKKINVDFM